MTWRGPGTADLWKLPARRKSLCPALDGHARALLWEAALHPKAGRNQAWSLVALPGPELAMQRELSLFTVFVCLLFVFVCWNVAFLLPKQPAGPKAAKTSLTLEAGNLWVLTLFPSHSEGLYYPPSTFQKPSFSLMSVSLEAHLWSGGKNALFLVFSGIYYFYGILDRQQRIKIKKKTTVDFLLSRKQAVLPI